MTPRIAWISPYLPEPATSGGSIRQQNLARALAQAAEVHLFARGEPWESRRAESPELGIFATRWVGRDYAPRWISSLLSGIRLDQTASRRVKRGSPVALWSAVREAHELVPFDAVVVSHCWAASGVAGLGLPWVLDEHNVESEFLQEALLSKGVSAARVASETRAIQDWERRVWIQASLLTCVSQRDSLPMASARRDRVPPVIVENGVDSARFEFPSSEHRAGGVLFVGAMHHAPNQEAALRLIDAIMPRVWSTRPDLGLTVVGGPVTRKLARAARVAKGRVELAGRVADTAPFLQRATVFANPLIRGAGSSLKTLEAIAAGVPLVSTECGARGYGLVPDLHYVQAETDDAFARAICDIDRAKSAVTSRAVAARSHAERFDWSILGQPFANQILDLITELQRDVRHPR